MGRRNRGTVAVLAAATMLGGALIVGHGSAGAEQRSDSPMTMCYVERDFGYTVFSKVDNRSEGDLVHDLLVESEEQTGPPHIDMDVVESRTVSPNASNTYAQDVQGRSGGPGAITYGNATTDATTGDETVFVYRNYHIPHVMDACG